MKELLFISLIALSFASCKKCGTCTMTVDRTASPSLSGYPQTDTYPDQEYCGEDYKKIKSGEKISTSQELNGSTVTSVYTYDCTDKGLF